MITAEDASQTVATTIFEVTGNDGPEPTANDFNAVRLGTTTDPTQFDAIQLIPLEGFAGGDCGAITAEFDTLKKKFIDELKKLWEKLFPGKPFPKTLPDFPDLDCATTVSDLVTPILEWGDKVS